MTRNNRFAQWIRNVRELGTAEKKIRVTTPKLMRVRKTRERLEQLKRIERVTEIIRKQTRASSKMVLDSLEREHVPGTSFTSKVIGVPMNFRDYVFDASRLYLQSNKKGKPFACPSTSINNMKNDRMDTMGTVFLQLHGDRFELHLSFAHPRDATSFVPAEWIKEAKRGIIHHVLPNVTRHHDSSRFLFVIRGRIPVEAIELYSEQLNRLSVTTEAREKYAQKWQKKEK